MKLNQIKVILDMKMKIKIIEFKKIEIISYNLNLIILD